MRYIFAGKKFRGFAIFTSQLRNKILANKLFFFKLRKQTTKIKKIFVVM